MEIENRRAAMMMLGPRNFIIKVLNVEMHRRWFSFTVLDDFR